MYVCMCNVIMLDGLQVSPSAFWGEHAHVLRIIHFEQQAHEQFLFPRDEDIAGFSCGFVNRDKHSGIAPMVPG